MCGVRMCGMEAQLNVRVHGVRVYGGVRMCGVRMCGMEAQLNVRVPTGLECTVV